MKHIVAKVRTNIYMYLCGRVYGTWFRHTDSRLEGSEHDGRLATVDSESFMTDVSIPSHW